LFLLKQGGIAVGELVVMLAETDAGKSTAYMNSRDKIEQHLIQQKAKSGIQEYDSAGNKTVFRCYYRGPNCTMCAAGCLIPDEEYTPDIETQGVWVKGISKLFPSDISNRELYYWQTYHDEFANVDGIHYSYEDWINGFEGASPTKFKELMLAKYGEIA
jgi:hypothetical protein